MLRSQLRTTSAVAITAVALVVAPARLSAQELTLLGYRATAPAAWTPVKTTSSMRLAQFIVGPEGTADRAEVVVYFFGTGHTDVCATRALVRRHASQPFATSNPASRK